MADSAYLFISPHLDDAVLSCGGYMRRLVTAGERVTLVTVVTADLPAGIPASRLARHNHLSWRLPSDPFAARRREDAAAAELLGAGCVHLGLLDAMYRRDATGQPLYKADTVGVPVHPADCREWETVVRQRLREALAACGDDPRVFCPLAVGDHVDHIVVRRAVEAVCRPQQITYYEDYPYVDRPEVVQPGGEGSPDLPSFGDGNGRGTSLPQHEPPLPRPPSPPQWRGGQGVRFPALWSSTTVALTPSETEARIAAVARYASQLPGLFPAGLDRLRGIALARLPLVLELLDLPATPRASREHMASAIRSSVARVGGERYWQRR